MRLGLGCLLWLILSAAQACAAGYDSFALGVSALNRGDNEQAIANFTSALNAGDLNTNLVPIAYLDRARLYFAKGECALAAADLTAAIKAKPDYADAYLLRASTDRCSNDDAAAIDDLTQSISLKPMTGAYSARGRVRWATSDFANAALDYAGAVKLAPKAPYALLWLELCRLRAGSFDKDVASREISTLDLDDWPEPILDFYVGKAVVDDVMRAAAKGDADVVVSQQCEANFYIAEFWLSQQKTDLAKPLLESAAAQCAHNFREYAAVRTELERLK